MRNTYTFNAVEYGKSSYLMEIDSVLLPFVINAVEGLRDRRIWKTYADYANADTAISKMETTIMQTNQLVESVDRIYYTLRQALVGEVFAQPQPGQIRLPLPAIPPALDSSSAAGLLAIIRDVQGIAEPGLFGIGQRYATLADVWRALQPDSQETADKMAGWLEGLQTAETGAEIFDTLRETVSDGAELAADGGLLAVQLSALVALMASLSLQSAQLLALIGRLDTLIDTIGTREGTALNVLEQQSYIAKLLE